jgi:hypothetical protein
MRNDASSRNRTRHQAGLPQGEVSHTARGLSRGEEENLVAVYRKGLDAERAMAGGKGTER